MKLTALHERLLAELRPHDGKTSPRDDALAVKLGVAERQIASMLADLSDASRIKINRQGGGRSIVVYADLADDADEISRRIQRQALRQPEPVVALAPAVRPAPAPEVKALHRALTVPEPTTATRKWPPEKGTPPSIDQRRPHELKIDDSYQRSIDTGPSRALIRRIAHGWDWRMFMPLVVSKRDDGLYVIDGQHRRAAAMLRGDIPWLPCCVNVYASVAEEAAMFVAINRARRAMNRLDDFHAAQAGADPDAVAITAMVEAVGFSISRRTGSASWAPGEVAFTSAIAKARRRSDTIPQEALRMMAEAFPGQRLVAGSSIFSATCSVLFDPPDDFDRGRLLLALKTFDMAGWASFLSDAKGGTDRAKSLRDMLLAAYADVARAA